MEQLRSGSIDPAGCIAVSKHIHTVLSHPDADAETVNIILEFIYTGIANIPADYLSRVITFVDYLTLDSLKSQCLVVGLRECYRQRMPWSFTLWLLDFVTMGVKLVLFCLKQDCIIEPVNLGITTGYDIEKALADIMQFLPIVGLYKMEMDKFSTFVLPYLSMFPLDMQKTLSAHYKLTYSGEWCDTIFSEILREDVFLDLLNRLCKQLKKPFGVDDNMFECGRLFLSSESVHINIDFHKACNGKSNTIVLIKTISGSILGGFVDTRGKIFGIFDLSGMHFCSGLIQMIVETSLTLNTFFPSFRNVLLECLIRGTILEISTVRVLAKVFTFLEPH
ncbi:hypothetical protein BCR33DRAFT_782125 [Rhizoclosmatium globosum]|uniref:BTB domain-containing protein n=1 Tax=Rhizoclosmatium globosum TaxID=329046 RepID=A0A1Y2CQC5_9FUNG|nr:hypothetical protein BCR33DRAFT_782125 [Rhizoclosmatium globosum]|eukprot:ORY49157.1 hypothetical protein BCR33DRAFT_782125 [Rhizoclosmatium globosum]